MNQSTTLAVVGGDVRQAYLAELLHEAGHTVRTFALERRPAAGCTAVSDLQACLCQQFQKEVSEPLPTLSNLLRQFQYYLF